MDTFKISVGIVPRFGAVGYRERSASLPDRLNPRLYFMDLVLETTRGNGIRVKAAKEWISCERR